MVDRLVGAAVIADAKDLLRAGLRDVQDWYGNPTITFQRKRIGSAGYDDVVTLTAISPKLDGMQAREALGAVETTTPGVVKVWANDVADLHKVQQGDVFDWQGRPCVVTLVQPIKVETYVAIEFRLKVEN